jgi:CBS domain-containing protein
MKSLSDTAATISARELRSERISNVARRQAVIVDSGTTIGETLQLMRGAGGEPAVVCDEGRVTGILTERDVLMKVLGHDVDLSSPVDELMTRDPDVLPSDAPMAEALQLMERGGYRTVPLVNGHGRVAGVLRQQDIIEYVAEAFPQEILNLPPRPHQLLEEPDGA